MIWRNRELVFELSKKDYLDRYQGQVFGLLWSIVHPMVLISIYTFVFSYVANTRPVGEGGSPVHYEIYILAGIIPWMAFADVLAKSSSSIRSNRSLIKQVIFPIEVLPVISVIVAMITQIIFTFLLALLVLYFNGTLNLLWLCLPLVFLVQFAGMVGIGYVISTVSVYFKDIKEILQVLTMVCMYLLPIFYLPNAIPEKLRWLVLYNPLSVGIYVYQDIIYYQEIVHPISWGVFLISSCALFIFGYRFFNRIKIYFGSVL